MDLIEELKKWDILGRSGSNFPMGMKWEMVKNNEAKRKYVICNAAEGELRTHKDHFILKNHAYYVLEGVKEALQVMPAEKGYIYLNGNYFEELEEPLRKLFGENDIEIVEKEGGYIGGEETAAIEVIENGSAEPRSKPPFPTEKGLWGCPTLVNNVESFYCAGKIKEGSYKGERFYSIYGDAPRKGVYELKNDATLKEILEDTGNIPDFDFFLQVGGGACGAIMLPEEMDSPVKTLGSIVIHKREGFDPYALMKEWIDFLLEGNCDKCTPCREGLYRIAEMVEKRNMEGVEEMFYAMKESSLCPLGRAAVTPFETLLEKIIKDHEDKDRQ